MRWLFVFLCVVIAVLLMFKPNIEGVLGWLCCAIAEYELYLLEKK